MLSHPVSSKNINTLNILFNHIYLNINILTFNQYFKTIRDSLHFFILSFQNPGCTFYLKHLSIKNKKSPHMQKDHHNLGPKPTYPSPSKLFPCALIHDDDDFVKGHNINLPSRKC